MQQSDSSLEWINKIIIKIIIKSNTQCILTKKYIFVIENLHQISNPTPQQPTPPSNHENKNQINK